MSEYYFEDGEVVIQQYPSERLKHGMITGKSPVGIKVTHIPTGIVEICESDRSQHRNREIALTNLWNKVKDMPSYSELAAQVEQLQLAAQPIVDDYFNWMEENEVDVQDLQPSYQKVYDMMVNLNNQLRQQAKGERND